MLFFASSPPTGRARCRVGARPAVSTVHTLPVGDLIEHKDFGDDCPCGPTVHPVVRDDGSVGWLISHRLPAESLAP